MQKKIALILLLFLNSHLSFGQTKKKFQLISNIQQEWQFRGCETLYYTSQIKPEILDSTIRVIASKKSFPLDTFFVSKQPKPFIITSKEQAYLIQELKKLKVFKWPKGMFPKSKCISISQANYVFTDDEKSKKEISRYCPIIYTFSKPIYLRNNSICLYLNQEQYGINNTPLSYSFYKKTNNFWERYTDVYVNMGSYEGDPEDEQKEVEKEKITQATTPDIGKIFNDSSLLKQTEFGKDVLTALQSSKTDSLKNYFLQSSKTLK